MGLISFGPKRGTWSTRCATDPRFNLQGEGSGTVSGGCPAITEAIIAKQRELGMSDAELDALTIETFFCKD